MLRQALLPLRQAVKAACRKFWAEGFQTSDLGAFVDNSEDRHLKPLGSDHKQLTLAITPGSRLEHLVRRFGLSRFETNVLGLALLPLLDHRYGALFGQLQTGDGFAWPASHLALDLFGPDDASPFRQLSSQGTLRSKGLLADASDPAEGHVGLELKPAAAVFDYLCGSDDVPAALTACVDILANAAATPADRSLWETVDRYARSDEAQDYPVLHVRGDPDAGLEFAMAEIIAAAGKLPYRLDAGLLPAGGRDQARLMNDLAREVRARDGVIMIVGCEVLAVRSPLAFNQLRRCLAAMRLRTLLLADHGAPPLRIVGRANVTTLAGPSRLAATGDPVDAAVCADLAATAALRDELAVDADAYRILRGDTQLRQSDVDSARRHLRMGNYAGLADRIRPTHGLDRMTLAQESRDQLQDLLCLVRQRDRVHGLHLRSSSSRGRGIAALFYGEPGTGKTLAAEAVAGELNRDLVIIDLAGVVSKYVGDTEKHLSRLFEEAEGDSCVLFFDEADALFGKRTEAADAKDRYANIEVSYLLQRVERHGGLVILATNNKSHIDQAFSRRLKAAIRFLPPPPELRLEMWQKAWVDVDILSADVDFHSLAKQPLNGATIANIAFYASCLASDENRKVSPQHLATAMKRELAKQGLVELPN